MISILLAQNFGPVEPAAFVSWLASACLVMLMVKLGLDISEKFKAKKAGETVIKNDPLRTQKVPELATKEEVQAMTRRIEADIEDLKKDREAAAAKQEDRIVKVHDRVNLAVESIDFVRGIVEGIQNNQQMIMAKMLK